MGLDGSFDPTRAVRKMSGTLITVPSDAPCCAGSAHTAAAAALTESCAHPLLHQSSSADICVQTASSLQRRQGYRLPLTRCLSSLSTGPDEIYQVLKRSKSGNRRICYSSSSLLCVHVGRNTRQQLVISLRDVCVVIQLSGG